MKEVKILENKSLAQNRDFRRFGENFHFLGTGSILGGSAPNLFQTLLVSRFNITLENHITSDEY